jgi:hypothetical protein
MPLTREEVGLFPFQEVDNWEELDKEIHPRICAWFNLKNPRRKRFTERERPVRNRNSEETELMLDQAGRTIRQNWVRRAGLAVYQLLGIHAIILQSLVDEVLACYGITKHHKQAVIDGVNTIHVQNLIGMYTCRIVNLFNLLKDDPHIPIGWKPGYDRPWTIPTFIKKEVMDKLHDMGLTWGGLRMKIAYRILIKTLEFRGLKQARYLAHISLHNSTGVVDEITRALWGITQLFSVVEVPDKRLYRTSSYDNVTRELIPGPRKETNMTKDLFTDLMKMYDTMDAYDIHIKRLEVREFERQVYKHLVRAILELHGSFSEQFLINLTNLKHQLGWKRQIHFCLLTIVGKLPTVGYSKLQQNIVRDIQIRTSTTGTQVESPSKADYEQLRKDLEKKVVWKNTEAYLQEDAKDKELGSIRNTFCVTLRDMIMRLDGLGAGRYTLRLSSEQSMKKMIEAYLQMIWELFECATPVLPNQKNEILQNHRHLFKITATQGHDGPVFANRMYSEAYEWFNKRMAEFNLILDMMGAMAPTHSSDNADDVPEKKTKYFKAGESSQAERFAHALMEKMRASQDKEHREDIKALRQELRKQKVDIIKMEVIIQAVGLLIDEFKDLDGPSSMNGYCWEVFFP